MAHMTDEEAKRLDEKWTMNPPKPGPNGTGYFTQCKRTAHTLTIGHAKVATTAFSSDTHGSFLNP